MINMIHILKFDTNKVSFDEVKKVFENIKAALNLKPNDELIAMPIGISWLYDYPIEELIRFKEDLESIIKEREQNDL